MRKLMVGGIFLAILATIIISPSAYNTISLALEKHSLKPPPHFKTLQDAKEVSVINLSTQSGMIKYPQDFTLLLVGDSMTEYLGNSDELKGYLNQYYPNKTFEVLNYGYGSTNILSIQDRLDKGTFHGREFRPILDIDFDLILIESMGHNPLSTYPLDEGLKKQNEALDKIVAATLQKHKKTKIVFVATIAPDKKTYAMGKEDLSVEVRTKWAAERDAYIENHISYAKAHNIPVIDIYAKSKDSEGNGKYIFISQTDHIHPSPTGVLFISKEIADYLAKNNLLQK